MKIPSLCLLVVILVKIHGKILKIGPTKPIQSTPITCDSTSNGHTSTNNTLDIFEFTLNTSSYVKISTCGSNFDTYLMLANSDFATIYTNNNDFNSTCGFNAVIDTDKLDAGTYFIAITGLGEYGDYFLALQCSEKGIPTIPEATGIPVQSDCKFVSAFSDGLGVQPLDICSLQVTSNVTDDLKFSRKYICNLAGDGILMISYDNDDCSGDGSVSLIEGQGETYYFNCGGSSDNCDIRSLNGYCTLFVFSLTHVVDQCAGGKMMSCDMGDLVFENYFDNNCVNFRNSSLDLPGGHQCAFISDCSGDIFPQTTEELPESSTCCACLNPLTEKGCEDQACEDIVCGNDPYCCKAEWDSVCVSEAEKICTASNGKITCGSSLTNDISSNNLADKFQFTLDEAYYVEISTCGSNFDTYLTLKNSNNITIIENDDDYSGECGVNAVINSDKLSPDTYTIIVTGFGDFVGAYNLAIQCDEDINPTMPTATGIPVESDCNFVAIGGMAQPLDICSAQYSFSFQEFSIKYVCNNENNEILQINYENGYCYGSGNISTFDGWGEKYYFNCDGLSSNCNEASLTQSCADEFNGTFTHKFAIGECVGRKMMSCNDNKLALNTYFDEDCMHIRNISFAPESDNNCTFISECSGDIFPETTEELSGNCIQYGCDVGFECDSISGECLRDCNIFAIDEYLLQCSNEFQSQENVINNLQTKINDLELQLLTVKQIVDALGVKNNGKKKSSETVPFILFTGDNYLKDMLVVLLCIINVLVVMYLCYDKRIKAGKGYVDVKRYIDEEEVSLQN